MCFVARAFAPRGAELVTRVFAPRGEEERREVNRAAVEVKLSKQVSNMLLLHVCPVGGAIFTIYSGQPVKSVRSPRSS